MRNVEDGIFKDYKTHNNVFPKNRSLYEIMWKNMVALDSTQVAIYHGAENMGFACRITKGKKNTHTLIIFNTF
jgi:hypothetical protein